MLDGIEHLTNLDGVELAQFHLNISCFKDMTWSSFGKHGLQTTNQDYDKDSFYRWFYHPPPSYHFQINLSLGPTSYIMECGGAYSLNQKQL
jgi:hypothetical protein